MPELAEVEIVRAALHRGLTGRRVVDVTVADPADGRFAAAAQLAGAVVTGVQRRGKYLLVACDDAREAVLHLGMTGQLRLFAAGETLPALTHLRARWTCDDGTRLAHRDVRGFGRVHVVTAGDYRGCGALASLGPEPLTPGFVRAATAALAGRNVAVKALLLDQRRIAGAGNYLADETLWAARVHPAARQLSAADARLVVAELEAQVRRALAAGGMSMRDYVHPDGSTGTHQQQLRCYGRAGSPCPRCGTLLAKTTVAGRGTTFCPACQPS